MADPKPIRAREQRASTELPSMSNQSPPPILEARWPHELASLLTNGYSKGNVVIVGMGHPLRCDDYVGSLIAKDLTKNTGNQRRVKIVDAEDSPENIFRAVWKNEPSLMVLIDSVDARLAPGSIILVDLNETSYPFYTTHNMPLRLILQAGPEVPRAILLGVQPGKLEVAGPLSDEVQQARMVIVAELSRILQKLRGGRDIG